jgi:hypothetical protein
MGCDIHLFVEVKKKRSFIDWMMFWKPKQWLNIDKWTRNKYFDKENDGSEPEFEIKREDRFYTYGRCYNLFCTLCGVRSNCFTGNPPIISEPKGLPKDVSKQVLIESDRYGSDGHSHNWNTLEELEAFDWSSYGETVKPFLDEVIPKMKTLNVKRTDVRIVYFFDN